MQACLAATGPSDRGVINLNTSQIRLCSDMHTLVLYI